MMTKLEIRPWMFLKFSIVDFQQVLRDAFKTQSKIYMVGTPPLAKILSKVCNGG